MKVVKVFLLSFCVFIVFVGCQPTPYTYFHDDTCKPKGWTEEQCRAAFPRGLRHLFGKEKAGKPGEYEVNYSILNVSEVNNEVKNFREDLKAVLDYNNKPARKFIDIHKLVPYLERQEKILEALDASLESVKLNNSFEQMTGLQTDYSYYGYNGNPHRDGYDFKKIFGNKDPVSAYPFMLNQIEEAKKQNKLKKIESFEGKFNRELDRKISDPDDPSDPKDENRFIWRPHQEWFSATTYKILDNSKPENNNPDYIEIYRLNQSDKKEKYPALKVFFPYGDTRGVLVLDTDKEGDPGFGLPNIVEQISISSLRDIMQNQALLTQVFGEKDSKQRIKPQPKPVFIEIAKIGQPIDLWEKSTDISGWTVPIKYKNTLSSNYKIKIQLERDSRNGNGNHLPELVTKIEYIAKEWLDGNGFSPSVGAVVEYFKLKSSYDGNVSKAEVKISESPKTISFIFEDGSIETGVIVSQKNKFIDDEPYAVEYTEGQKRWRIEKDNGSNIFNKRKEIGLQK